VTDHRPRAPEIDLFCRTLSCYQTARRRWNARRPRQLSQGAIQSDNKSLDVTGSGREDV